MKKGIAITTAALLVLGFFVLIGTAVFVLQFPQHYPEKTLEIEERLTRILQQITLPLKLARLQTQEAPRQILMPVYGVAVSEVTDTWGAPRGEERVHEGQDVFAPTGTPVFSATYGYVTRVGEGSLGGNYVRIRGTGGRSYYYAHLDSIAEGLHVGQEVYEDTVIGFVGNTGNAEETPPHLHFGVYQQWEALDPLPLLIDRE